jgi:hypothetical protein
MRSMSCAVKASVSTRFARGDRVNIMRPLYRGRAVNDAERDVNAVLVDTPQQRARVVDERVLVAGSSATLSIPAGFSTTTTSGHGRRSRFSAADLLDLGGVLVDDDHRFRDTRIADRGALAIDRHRPSATSFRRATRDAVRSRTTAARVGWSAGMRKTTAARRPRPYL